MPYILVPSLVIWQNFCKGKKWLSLDGTHDTSFIDWRQYLQVMFIYEVKKVLLFCFSCTCTQIRLTIHKIKSLLSFLFKNCLAPSEYPRNPLQSSFSCLSYLSWEINQEISKNFFYLHQILYWSIFNFCSLNILCLFTYAQFFCTYSTYNWIVCCRLPTLFLQFFSLHLF